MLAAVRILANVAKLAGLDLPLVCDLVYDQVCDLILSRPGQRFVSAQNLRNSGIWAASTMLAARLLKTPLIKVSTIC